MSGDTTETAEGANAGGDADIDTDLELVIVVAVADNGVIGDDDDLPWHIPEDLEFFKRTTVDHPVIMGRTTYESIRDRIGGPLPDRTSIVLTSRDLEPVSTDDARVVIARDVNEAIRLAERAAREYHDGVEQAMVAGGASIYEQTMALADRMLLTEVHERPDGDVSFPSWNRTNWREVSREDRNGFSFVEYVRNRD